MCLGVCSAVAEPFSITRVYGKTSLLQRINPDGTAQGYLPTFGSFVDVHGVEWDWARERLVFLAELGGGARIASIDGDFDPATLTTLRSGLSTGARQVDVDPASGRLYWWEAGQILSVAADGSGTPVVEADGVPEPEAMEIDVERGVYLVLPLSLDELVSGPLDGSASGVTQLPLSEASNGFVGDVAIDPITGDFVWSEAYQEVVGFSIRLGNGVVRSTNTFGSPTVVYGSLDPMPTTDVSAFFGVAAVDDQIVVMRTRPPGGTSATLERHDTTTGETDIVETLQAAGLLDAAFRADPVIVQPQNVLVDEGELATLEVASFDPEATYQWRRNGVMLLGTDRVTGTTGPKLTITPAQPADTDVYTCVVTDSDGVVQESDAAVLAVRAGAPPCAVDLAAPLGVLDVFDVIEYLAQLDAGCK